MADRIGFKKIINKQMNLIDLSTLLCGLGFDFGGGGNILNLNFMF